MAPLITDKYYIKEKLISKAKSLGFLELKIAEYRLLNDEFDKYSEWIEGGYNATMGWMERNYEKRLDVRQILAGTKSVITLSQSYFTGNIHPANLNGNDGKVSRYAWGADYHEIVLKKINEIESELKLLSPDSVTKSYVDTGPVMEKLWAVLSGLGWQGKNSLILNKNYGSFFFIGIIFTDLELPADSPVKDYCQTCRKCIDACPTNAIIADKVVDSNKCISYWTIEAKPDVIIPESIAKNSENWIYGCDICQEVCPWNKNKPVITGENQFHSRLENGILSKDEIENMSPEEFSRRFQSSPVKRLKLAGLKRNAVDILSLVI